SQANRRELLAVADVDAADEPAFWEAYWASRSELDRFGITIADYWRAVGESLGRDWSARRIHQLWVTDFTGWLSLNPGTVAVLE
ncbi:hypothetical protein ACC691_40150, partial [Rhizobium johnstonii]|uniref:hypothetical protein n=1 Tax=Rhizobium johnstonii TaxID=3019933 RepID=UPI003F97710E